MHTIWFSSLICVGDDSFEISLEGKLQNSVKLSILQYVRLLALPRKCIFGKKMILGQWWILTKQNSKLVMYAKAIFTLSMHTYMTEQLERLDLDQMPQYAESDKGLHSLLTHPTVLDTATGRYSGYCRENMFCSSPWSVSWSTIYYMTVFWKIWHLDPTSMPQP